MPVNRRATISPQPHRPGWVKWVLIGFLGVIVLVIGGFTAAGKYSTYKDHQVLDAAAAQIILPTNYHLVSESFSDPHCLDVCANITLYYRVGSQAGDNEQILQQALHNAGYTSGEGYYPTKEVKGQIVHVEHSSELESAGHFSYVLSL